MGQRLVGLQTLPVMSPAPPSAQVSKSPPPSARTEKARAETARVEQARVEPAPVQEGPEPLSMSPTPMSDWWDPSAEASHEIPKSKRQKYRNMTSRQAASTEPAAVTRNAQDLLAELQTHIPTDVDQEEEKQSALLLEQQGMLSSVQGVSIAVLKQVTELAVLRSLVGDPAHAVTIVNLTLCHSC